MSSRQEKVIELIRNFSPRDFGVKDLYYKTNKNEIELLFVVKKSGAPSLISYLNSLSDIAEKKADRIKVTSSVYIYDNDKQLKVRGLVEGEKLKKISLINSRHVSVCP